MSGADFDDARILTRSSRQAWKHDLCDLDNWHDPLLIEDATVDVHGVGRFELRAATDDLYHVLPYREQRIFDEICMRLRCGDTFVDAGANIGVFTVLAGKIVGPNGQVISIEMIPETAARLRRHIALNHLSNITVLERALSDRVGERIMASIPQGRFGQASIVAPTRGHSLAVETTTLDEVMRLVKGPINLIKLDVEGAEAQALAGAHTALQRTEAVIFEQLRDNLDVPNLLTAAGFKIRPLDTHNFIAER